jgi:hypothetical protein
VRLGITRFSIPRPVASVVAPIDRRWEKTEPARLGDLLGTRETNLVNQCRRHGHNPIEHDHRPMTAIRRALNDPGASHQ